VSTTLTLRSDLICRVHPPLQLRQNQLLIVRHLLAQRLDSTQLSYQVRCGLWCFWRWRWHWFQHWRQLRGCCCCLGCRLDNEGGALRGGYCRRCRSSYSVPPVVKRRHAGVLQSFLRFRAQFDFGSVDLGVSVVVAKAAVASTPQCKMTILAKIATPSYIRYTKPISFHS
jgi:hypothetical protein